jgi:hypothetical protein
MKRAKVLEAAALQLGGKRREMTTIKFVVKVNRTGTRGPAYVLSMDRGPIQMTSNRKRALVMGKFAAEDAIRSLTSSQSIAELVTVKVTS